MKPREFWVNQMQVDKPLFASYNSGDAPPFIGSIRVREVVPIDWALIFKRLDRWEREQHGEIPHAEYLYELQQLVEKQLGGKE